MEIVADAEVQKSLFSALGELGKSIWFIYKKRIEKISKISFLNQVCKLKVVFFIEDIFIITNDRVLVEILIYKIGTI